MRLSCERRKRSDCGHVEPEFAWPSSDITRKVCVVIGFGFLSPEPAARFLFAAGCRAGPCLSSALVKTTRVLTECRLANRRRGWAEDMFKQ